MSKQQGVPSPERLGGSGRHRRAGGRRLVPLAAVTVCLAVAGSVLVPMATRATDPAQAAPVNFSESFTGTTLTNPGDWSASYAETASWIMQDDANSPPCLTARPSGSALTLGSGTMAGCADLGSPDVAGSGALRLIRDLAGTDKTQAASVIYRVAQPASAGLDITFKMALWDETTAADGLVFFLKDGANNTDVPGAAGGSLGYAPDATSDGVPQGLIGIGFDKWGNFSGQVAACPGGDPLSPNAAVANSIVIRGPGNAKNGYCYLAGSQNASYFTGSTRQGAARQVRILVEDSTVPSPKVKVYFGAVGATLTTPVLEVAVPAQLASASTFKFGFGAASGWYKISAAVWDLAITPMPSPATVTAPSGTMIFGSTPPALGAATAAQSSNPSNSVTLTTPPTCGVYDSGGVNPVTLSATTPVGTYVVKCTGGSASAYSLDTYVNGVFTVTAAPAPPAPPASVESSSPEPPVSSPSPTRVVGNLDPIPNQVNRNVPPVAMPQGQSLYLVDGQPREVRVAPDAPRDATGIEATGDGWWMKLVGRGDDADPLGITEKQALILQSDQLAGRNRQAPAKKRVNPVAQAAGGGFKANSPVKFYLLPSTYLGQLGTDGSGAFSGTIPVPPGIKPGAYTLQMNGYSPTDSVRSLSIAVIVKPTTRPVMQSRARVTFDPLDASLDAKDRKVLTALARKAGRLGVRSVVLGFVQPTSVRSNDLSLSTQRAKNVAAFLRARGLKGAYVISGKGRATEKTAIARRVVVTVTYEAP